MKIVAFTLGTQKRISFTKENSNGFIEAYQLNTQICLGRNYEWLTKRQKIFFIGSI